MSEGDDVDDFAEFAAAQAPALRRLAYGLTGRWDRADDLVQGTFERALSRWGKVSRAEDPAAYVRRMLVNLATDEGRRPWRRHEVTVPETVSTDVLPGAGGVEVVGPRVDLARALAGLTVKQRAVLVLRFYEDRSVEDVAALLGVGEGTVKRQTWEALRRIRGLLPDLEQAAAQVDATARTSAPPTQEHRASSRRAAEVPDA